MKVEVLKSFEKDIAKVKDPQLANKVLDVIKDIENYNTLFEIRQENETKWQLLSNQDRKLPTWF